MTDPTTSMKDDLYASVTGRIIAALERGAPPWVRPWSLAMRWLDSCEYFGAT
jgi:antirestriction protein ArdC